MIDTIIILLMSLPLIVLGSTIGPDTPINLVLPLKCVDAFRITLTEKPRLFIKGNIVKTVNCLFYYYPPTPLPFFILIPQKYR